MSISPPHSSGQEWPARKSNVIAFPARGPFTVCVVREAGGLGGWIVAYRKHGWLLGSRDEAFAEALALARGWGTGVQETRS